jgi:hypothetical protein
VQRQRIFTRTLLVIPQHVLVIPHHHALSFRSAAEESAFAFLGCHSASPCFVIPQRSEGICICLSWLSFRITMLCHSAAQRRNLHLPLLRTPYKPSFRPKQDTLHRPAQRRNPCISGCQADERKYRGLSTPAADNAASGRDDEFRLSTSFRSTRLSFRSTRLSFRSTALVIPQHHACHSAAPCLSFRSAAKESAFASIVCHSRKQSESRPCLSFRSTAKESAFAFVTCIPEGNLSLALACHSAAQRRNLHSPLSFVIPKGNLRLAFPSFSPEIPQRLSRSHHRSLGQP